MDRELGGWVRGCRKGGMGCGRMDGWKGMDRWVGGEMHVHCRTQVKGM